MLIHFNGEDVLYKAKCGVSAFIFFEGHLTRRMKWQVLGTDMGS
jgi:hypothetical protein